MYKITNLKAIKISSKLFENIKSLTFEPNLLMIVEDETNKTYFMTLTDNEGKVIIKDKNPITL